MLVITKIEAVNDSNGNPRRGWHVIQFEGGSPREGWWVEEGFSGRQSLKDWLRNNASRGETVAHLGTYAVPASEYRRVRNDPMPN
jgi:hypothetical protein